MSLSSTIHTNTRWGYFWSTHQRGRYVREVKGTWANHQEEYSTWSDPIMANEQIWTLICHLPDLHKFIQERDIVALTNCKEGGAHLPMLLDSLDLALWTSLFVTATNNPNKTIANIQYAHAILNDLLMQDEQEATIYIYIYKCSWLV